MNMADMDMEREERSVPHWTKRMAVKRFLRSRKQAAQMRIKAFYAMLFIIAIIGLIIPLRPKTSTIEKRELEKWPEFSSESFWDGSYFNGISTWYADTFPFRESLISLNMKFQNLYGLKGEQIVHNTTPVQETQVSDHRATEETPVAEEEEPAEISAADAKQGAGTIQAVPEQIGDIYVTGDTGFELFYFYQDGADQYVDYLSEIASKLAGISDVYVLSAPNSVGVMLSEEAQEKMGISLQSEAIDYIYGRFREKNPDVNCVNAFPNLAEHNDEYIYFRTDHHWTARGAYYAYLAFCDKKGLTPNSLDQFEKMEFPDFLGTLYSGSNQAPSLEANPDTIEAFIPMATNDMVFIGNDNVEYDWHVVSDATEWDTSAKYNCFIGSDEPFSYIENPNLTDGSSILVVKESYGNAFVPFLVDHYQTTYVVDYRYFYLYSEYNNNLMRLIQDKGIQDVLFLNTTSVMMQPAKSEEILEMFP